MDYYLNYAPSPEEWITRREDEEEFHQEIEKRKELASDAIVQARKREPEEKKPDHKEPDVVWLGRREPEEKKPDHKEPDVVWLGRREPEEKKPDHKEPNVVWLGKREPDEEAAEVVAGVEKREANGDDA